MPGDKDWPDGPTWQAYRSTRLTTARQPTSRHQLKWAKKHNERSAGAIEFDSSTPGSATKSIQANSTPLVQPRISRYLLLGRALSYFQFSHIFMFFDQIPMTALSASDLASRFLAAKR